MMKLLGITLLVALVSASHLDLSAPALNDALINEINSIPNHPWKAARNEYFEGKTVGDVVRMLGERNDKWGESVPMKTVSIPNDLPEEFDGRTDDAWFGCVHEIRDQGRCGSCWAFSAAGGLTDRFCIASEGAIDVVLSPQDLVSCDKGNAGCQGGSGPSSASYLVDTGIVTDTCYPYLAKKKRCPKFAKKGCPGDKSEEPVKYQGSEFFQVENDEAQIRAEYYENGPCYIRFDVFSDFMSYAGGVYIHTSGSRLGGHAVRPVGWGTDEESGLDYWLVANSWGSFWGEDGFFKIVRGQNEVGIEGGVVCTVPDLESPTRTL